MLWKDILSHESPELGIPWPVIHWSSSTLIARCLTFSLVTRMKLTYHPTLELAPSATCLQKCWMRAWTGTTFSLTLWRTCTVLDSSFGRSLGDVYQEVSDSDVAGAAADPSFLVRNQSYCIVYYIRFDFIFPFISVDAVTVLPEHGI